MAATMPPLEVPNTDPFSDVRAAGETAASLVSIGKDRFIVVELPGELIALGDWSFFRQPRVLYGPSTENKCLQFIGDRIGRRLGVGRHAKEARPAVYSRSGRGQVTGAGSS